MAKKKKELHTDFRDYPETEHYYYEDVPVYERYETVREPRYCETCGQEDGYNEHDKGVNLLGYKKRKFKKDGWYYLNRNMAALVEDTLTDSLSTSPLFSKMSWNGKKIKIPSLKK